MSNFKRCHFQDEMILRGVKIKSQWIYPYRTAGNRAGTIKLYFPPICNTKAAKRWPNEPALRGFEMMNTLRKDQPELCR